MKLLASLPWWLLGCGAWAAPLTDVQSLSGQELCSVVRHEVAAEAGAQGYTAQVECPAARSVQVPMGSLTWTLDTRSLSWSTGPGRVVMRLQAAGGVDRELAVPISLVLHSKAWVARHDMAAGEWITADAVHLSDLTWPAGVPAQAVSDTAPNGRLRQALHAGQAVLPKQLVPANQKLQGDAVKVTLHSAGLTLEMPAVLASHAVIGQSARVQLKGRSETLDGVLVDASTVIVER